MTSTILARLRALVVLCGLTALVFGMVSVFVQIFLYQRFGSVALNIAATMILYTGIMVGFCVPGFCAARWRLNIKHGFLASFIAMGVAIALLPLVSSTNQACWALFVWGVGQGVFWLAVNTFELAVTRDEDRDFYASALSASNQVLGFAGPAAATLLIWLSGNVFGLGPFTLLFVVASAVFLPGFFFFGYLDDYRPGRLVWADISHFFHDRRNRIAQVYTAGMGLQQAAGVIIPPLAILFVLGTPLRVGAYDTLLALLSAVFVLIVARWRTQSNRLLIYGITALGLAGTTAWFGYSLTLAGLVVYAVLEGVLSPLNTVSSHVVDLRSMEIGRRETDFYATMLLRDFMLWVWRMVGGTALLLLVSQAGPRHGPLSLGLYLLAAAILLTYLGAFFLLRAIRDDREGKYIL